MRFIAPMREQVDSSVFSRPPLSRWHEFAQLIETPGWPCVDELNSAAERADVAGRAFGEKRRFVEQTPALLADGLHYERRIADRGEIATREGNWHDLLNALVWLRYPALKTALNARQVAEIAVAGPKRRTRAQCALTHFDEAGVVVLLHDPALLALWDAHDWHGLFWREREAWIDGRVAAHVFGHALLEHALKPGQLLVGKALVVMVPERGNVEGDSSDSSSAAGRSIAELAAAIRRGELLNDPQELRPLPLSGIPGWHPDSTVEAFYRDAPCFCPLRMGRRYPNPYAQT
jgi:Protein of unknown function (DUF3025)